MIAAILDYAGPVMLGISAFCLGRRFPGRGAMEQHDAVVKAACELEFAQTVRELIAEFSDEPVADLESEDQVADHG